jgi:hypothetical protein
MKVLNLGWNNIGSTQSKLFADTLNQLLQDESLAHLDLSHNSIKKEACAIISQGLNNNHTLFGLHIEGCEASIDTNGFMKVCDRLQGCSIDFKSSLYITSSSKIPSRNHVSNCWLCEGWSEQFIKLTKQIDLPVYIHISFENYQGKLMPKSSKGNHYELWQIAPPGEFTFFFSHMNEVILDDSYPKVNCNLEMQVFYVIRCTPMKLEHSKQIN